MTLITQSSRQVSSDIQLQTLDESIEGAPKDPVVVRDELKKYMRDVERRFQSNITTVSGKGAISEIPIEINPFAHADMPSGLDRQKGIIRRAAKAANRRVD